MTRPREDLPIPTCGSVDSSEQVSTVPHNQRDLERRHREGYECHPAKPGEFDAWEDEQVWPD